MSAAMSVPVTVKELVQTTIQANKDHQYALKVYTERLEAEIEAVDKLLAAAETPNDEPDVDVGGHITIEGAAKAIGPVSSEIPPDEHPFAEDVEQRQKYLQYTTIHPMKASDLEALADAVRSENHRIHALEAQKRGQQPFVSLNDYPMSYFEQNKHGINWERVAQKVTAAVSNPVQRTAQECEIRWLGERHPDFDRSSWSQSEISKVKQLAGNSKEGEIDWVDIAAKLGTKRMPIDCMRHAIPRKMHTWTPESDQRLLEMVKVYGNENWQLVARGVSEDATATQCQARYTRTLDPHIKRGPWTREEDERLQRAVEIFGRSWSDVCTFVFTRSNEQCRDRWQDTSNPTVGKGRWTDQENQALLAAYEELGDKWKDISLRVGNGRTDNMCRHRYNHLARRKLKEKATNPTSREVPVSTPESVPGPSSLHRQSSHPSFTTQDNSRAETPSTEASNTSIRQKPRPKPKPRPHPSTEHAEVSLEAKASIPQAEQYRSSTPMDLNAIQTAPDAGDAQVADNSVPNRSPEPPGSQFILVTPNEAMSRQVLGSQRGRGRPRKRPRADTKARTEPPPKRKRTSEAEGQEVHNEDALSAGATGGSKSSGNLEESPENVQAGSRSKEQQSSQVDIEPDPEQPPDAKPTHPSSSKRGRKKRDPTSRPAPTRQSARLRNVHGTISHSEV